MEEMVLDRRLDMLNANMVDYKWRTFSELPRLRMWSQTPFKPSLPCGGVERWRQPQDQSPVMAASNALGVWLHEYPVTGKGTRALAISQSSELHAV
jgi:xanthine dehydrogenase molybdenum-binding subunit